MEISDILKGREGGNVEFQTWFGEKGFSNICSADLDKIIDTYTSNVFGWRSFMEIYIAKKNEESSKTVEKWTVRVGWMTVVMTIATLINLYVSWK